METVVRVRKVCSVEEYFEYSNQSFKIRAVMAQSRLMVFYARKRQLCVQAESSADGRTVIGAPQAVFCVQSPAVKMFGWQTQVGT